MIELPRNAFGLAPQEVRFVETLLNATFPIVSHKQMTIALSGHDDSLSGIAKVIACKTRKRLEKTFDDPIIETVWGRGYRLNDGARDLILQAAGFDVREAA